MYEGIRDSMLYVLINLNFVERKRSFCENDFRKECIYRSIAFTVHLRSANALQTIAFISKYSFTKQIICCIHGCLNSDFCSELKLVSYGLSNAISFGNANIHAECSNEARYSELFIRSFFYPAFRKNFFFR